MSQGLRIMVAVKHGVDVALVRADPASGLVNLEAAPRKTSDFDKNAVEEAVRIRERHGGTVTVLSVGGPAAREALREALALGADEAVLVTTDAGASGDTRAVAHLLARALSALGGFDLLLVGEGSTDHFSGLLGPRVAAELGIPDVAYVRRLTVDAEGILAEKDLEQEVEVVWARFPAVVTVGQEINTPRIPTFSGILKASKKEARVLTPAEIGATPDQTAGTIVCARVAVPEVPRKQVTITGATPAEIAERTRAVLQDEGVLP